MTKQDKLMLFIYKNNYEFSTKTDLQAVMYELHLTDKKSLHNIISQLLKKTYIMHSNSKCSYEMTHNGLYYVFDLEKKYNLKIDITHDDLKLNDDSCVVKCLKQVFEDLQIMKRGFLPTHDWIDNTYKYVSDTLIDAGVKLF